jgi:hypothetical protein
MLRIYSREGGYSVAFHEFVKSIMLGYRRYYNEDQSPILNIFNVGSEKNASHFTACRLIWVLLAHREESSREGRGYVEVGHLLAEFENRFDNREDAVSALGRLLRRQLIESNTRSSESLEGTSHVRVTSAGWYYVNYLIRSFAYLDLVLQDTPLDDTEVEGNLRQSVFEVDNLSDRDEEKIRRVNKRFERVERFLAYLNDEEDSERL